MNMKILLDICVEEADEAKKGKDGEDVDKVAGSVEEGAEANCKDNDLSKKGKNREM